MNNQRNPALSEEQVNVCFRKGTEPPFSGKYVNNHETGMYQCANCGAELFSSSTKFDSGTGWPSFYDEAVKGHVKTHVDTSMGMHRIEIMCANCEAHLGHVFDDPTSLKLRGASGPNPTGKRYCVNSLALDFKKSE